MNTTDPAIRTAAFAHCRRLLRDFGGAVPAAAIERGFQLDGEHIHIANRARGIHRPRQMRRGVLSIKTTKPRQGRTARYDDNLSGDGYFSGLDYRCGHLSSSAASSGHPGLTEAGLKALTTHGFSPLDPKLRLVTRCWKLRFL